MIMQCSRSILIVALGIAIVPFIPFLFFKGSGSPGFSTVFACLMILWIGIYTCAQSVRRKDQDIVFIIAVLFIFAALLILVPELYLLEDSFRNRMNTIFKFHYQAWIILALLSPLLLFYSMNYLSTVRGKKRKLQPIWIGFLILIFVSSGYYVLGSSIDKTNGFSNVPSLDGLSKVKFEDPGELAAIQWLLNHSRPGEGLVEAVGPDYSEFGRVSAATGVSTILGWIGHERQWRGPNWDPSSRLNDVQSIYHSSSDEELLMLLKKYDIQYVVLGARERSTYPDQNLATKINVLEVAFFEDDFLLYRLKLDEGLNE
jgi:uncharacterized membrane protein